MLPTTTVPGGRFRGIIVVVTLVLAALTLFVMVVGSDLSHQPIVTHGAPQLLDWPQLLDCLGAGWFN